MRSTTILACSLALLAFSSSAGASTLSWRLDFDEELLAGNDAKLFVVPGEVAFTFLHVQQNDFCPIQPPGEQNPGCPLTATLSFEPLPAGLSACFVTTAGCEDEIGVFVGATVGVRLTVNPLAAFQVATLRANALGSTFTFRTTSMPVHVVPPLFDPPSSVKLFRGGPSKTITLPLNRPAALSSPLSLRLFFEEGSTSTGIQHQFSPQTLSPSATSTTLALDAASNASVGTRDVAIAALLQLQLHSMLAPFEVVIADAFTVTSSPFFMHGGTTVTHPIIVTRDPEFTDPIELSISGLSGGPGLQAKVSHGQLVVQAAAGAQGSWVIGLQGRSGTITYHSTVTVFVFH